MANLSRVLIREAPGADKNQGLALFVGKSVHGTCRFRQLHGPHLLVVHYGHALRRTIVPGRLAPSAAPIGIELIAQDGEEPCLEIRAWTESGARLPRLGERLLRKIVGEIAVTAQRAGKRAQERNEFKQTCFELCVGVATTRCLPGNRVGCGDFHLLRFPFLPPASSICRRRSRNSSGTGSCTTSS